MNVILGITGSIAAYKAAELANLLTKEGKAVHTIMTGAALKFITPLTLQSLTKQKVYTDMFEEIIFEDIRHISLASRANVFVIAPATANIIGKIAAGIADDMLTTVVMATTAPVIICPAMNTAMYENPIVQDNIKKLTSLGYIFVEPRESRLACGDLGRGAMANIETIAQTINQVLNGESIAGTSCVTPHDNSRPLRDFTQYSLAETENLLKDPQVSLLFQRVEEILGKLLKDTERQMYLSFYDELGLSIGVIEFLLKYCLERGKKGNSYIRTVAQNWAEQGISEVEEAKEYVRLFNNEYRDILRFFGVTGRDPIPKEIEYMHRWLKEDSLPLEIIKLACEKTIINQAKVNFPYADSILNKWKQENIKTIEDIERLEKTYYDNITKWKRPIKTDTSRNKFQNFKGRG
jgi:phosphopantothenoylcysteine decarboxylase/phosphopantothenoylcysteine decarboxylase/phosphopantothenate--cysteine ligase